MEFEATPELFPLVVLLEFDDEPADEVPADEVPVDDVPVDDEPADEVPADEVPVDDEPDDVEPADEVPADDVGCFPVREVGKDCDIVGSDSFSGSTETSGTHLRSCSASRASLSSSLFKYSGG